MADNEMVMTMEDRVARWRREGEERQRRVEAATAERQADKQRDRGGGSVAEVYRRYDHS